MTRAIEEYSHNAIVYNIGGVDPDRFNFDIYLIFSDVARWSLHYNAYVVTNDSDFFVYRIRGVIDLDSLIIGYQQESRY